MAKTTYTATAPDGTIATRKTDRTYTHCVVVADHKHYKKDGKYGAYSWAGRRDLAEKKAAEARRDGHQKVAIVEAEVQA